MSLEANKALVRRLFEESDHRQGDLPAELFGPNYAAHFTTMPMPLNLDGHVQMTKMFYAAFPDLHHTIEDQIAEGDKVFTRATARGTHLNAFMGIPATGKSFAITITSLDRVMGDEIVEEWVLGDTLGMMQQLGAIPAPQAS
ncbi:MAG: ester cyclase [Chloroflexi bacterium]|nr:ester cyclase [Chloroflexota bacterium]